MTMALKSPKRRRLILSSAVMLVIVLPCCLATRCGNTAPTSPPSTATHGPYTTDFPLTENPISEDGNWINGGTVGLDWNNIYTSGGFAGGVGPASASYSDPTAVLTGPWISNQSAQGTVYSSGASDSYYQEVELRLRTTVTAHSITGYELSCRTPNNSSAYCGIVRWNGPLGSWTGLTPTCTYPTVGPGCGTVLGFGVSNRDVMRATVSGSTLSLYVNGTLIAQATESTYTSGSPGIGVDYNCDNTYANFGFTDFSASDGLPNVAPSAQFPSRLLTGAVFGFSLAGR